VQHLISNQGVWNDWNKAFGPGYADTARSVYYITSYDLADGPRLMNIILGPVLESLGLGDGGVQNVRDSVDGASTSSNPTLQTTVEAALRRGFLGIRDSDDFSRYSDVAGRRRVWRRA